MTTGKSLSMVILAFIVDLLDLWFEPQEASICRLLTTGELALDDVQHRCCRPELSNQFEDQSRFCLLTWLSTVDGVTLLSPY